MIELIFTLLTANIIIFASLGAATWSSARSEPTLPVSRSMRAVSLMSWAMVVEAFTQMALTALKLEWLPDRLQDLVFGPWHLAQSLAILGTTATSATLLRRARRLAACRSASPAGTLARSVPR